VTKHPTGAPAGSPQSTLPTGFRVQTSPHESKVCLVVSYISLFQDSGFGFPQCVACTSNTRHTGWASLSTTACCPSRCLYAQPTSKLTSVHNATGQSSLICTFYSRALSVSIGKRSHVCSGLNKLHGDAVAHNQSWLCFHVVYFCFVELGTTLHHAQCFGFTKGNCNFTARLCIDCVLCCNVCHIMCLAVQWMPCLCLKV